MTKKRFHKLLYALLQRMYQAGARNGGWGRILKAAMTAKPFPNNPKGCKSYQEVWDYLLPVRQNYGM